MEKGSDPSLASPPPYNPSEASSPGFTPQSFTPQQFQPQQQFVQQQQFAPQQQFQQQQFVPQQQFSPAPVVIQQFGQPQTMFQATPVFQPQPVFQPGFASPQQVQFVNVQAPPPQKQLGNTVTGSELGYALSGAVDSSVTTGAVATVANSKAAVVATENQAKINMMQVNNQGDMQHAQQRAAMESSALNAKAAAQNAMLALNVANTQQAFSTVDPLVALDKQILQLEEEIVAEENKIYGCMSCGLFVCGAAKRKRKITKKKIKQLQEKQRELEAKKDIVAQDRARATSSFAGTMMQAPGLNGVF